MDCTQAYLPEDMTTLIIRDMWNSYPLTKEQMKESLCALAKVSTISSTLALRFPRFLVERARASLPDDAKFEHGVFSMKILFGGFARVSRSRFIYVAPNGEDKPGADASCVFDGRRCLYDFDDVALAPEKIKRANGGRLPALAYSRDSPNEFSMDGYAKFASQFLELLFPILECSDPDTSIFPAPLCFVPAPSAIEAPKP